VRKIQGLSRIVIREAGGTAAGILQCKQKDIAENGRRQALFRTCDINLIAMQHKAAQT
jgi:hypothetical protein